LNPGQVDGNTRAPTVGPKLGRRNAEIFCRMGLGEQDIETLQAQRVV
jgi:hypothetical protein